MKIVTSQELYDALITRARAHAQVERSYELELARMQARREEAEVCARAIAELLSAPVLTDNALATPASETPTALLDALLDEAPAA